MNLPALDETEIQKIIEAWKATGSYNQVSKETGYARSTCRKYIERAAAKEPHLGHWTIWPVLRRPCQPHAPHSTGIIMRDFAPLALSISPS